MNSSKTRRWHRVVGTVVGIQLLIWLLTGLYFNLTPNEYVRGITYIKTIAPSGFSSAHLDKSYEPSQLLFQYPNTKQVELLEIANQPYFLLSHKITRYQHECQQQTLISAKSYKEASINKALAIKIAKQSYKGSAVVLSARRYDGAHWEWPKECNSLWRIDFADELNTRVYVRAINGQVVGHKNAYTEISDWMFRLHFLDYFNQGSFNHVFAWFFAGLALLLSLSGLSTIYYNFRNKRYRKKPKHLKYINK